MWTTTTWVPLTVDGELRRLAAAAAADRVAGHAAVGASVLFLHGADEQRGVVFGEAVSVAGAQHRAVPQPLERDPRPSLNGAGPGGVCLVLHRGVRRALGHDWDGHGDWGEDRRGVLVDGGRLWYKGGGCHGDEGHSPSTVRCTVLSSLITSPVLLWNTMLRFRW